MKVRIKSEGQFESLMESKEIRLLFSTESGMVSHYATGIPEHVLTVSKEDHGKEFLVVDHPNPISKAAHSTLRAFFEEDQS